MTKNKSQDPSQADIAPEGTGVADDPIEKASDSIRKVMVEQKRARNQKALPELEPASDPEPKKDSELAKTVKELVKQSKKAPRAPKPARGSGMASKLMSKVQPRQWLQRFLSIGIVERSLKRIREYRPTPKHIFFAVLAIIIYLRPWLIPILLFVLLLLAVIIYLTLGPDRVSEMVAKSWHWLAGKKPELAESLKTKTETGIGKLEKLLGKLPEKWTSGLYLPDLSQSQKMEEAIADQPDPFDRLAEEDRKDDGLPL